MDTPYLPLLPILLWPEVVVLVRVPFIGQIDRFWNYSYSIGPCAKRNKEKTKTKQPPSPQKNKLSKTLLRNNPTKNSKRNIQWTRFPNYSRQVDMLLNHPILVKISEMTFNNCHHLKYSDYWPYLYCYSQNVSADVSFGLLQVRIIRNTNLTLVPGDG